MNLFLIFFPIFAGPYIFPCLRLANIMVYGMISYGQLELFSMAEHNKATAKKPLLSHAIGSSNNTNTNNNNTNTGAGAGGVQIVVSPRGLSAAVSGSGPAAGPGSAQGQEQEVLSPTASSKR